MKDNISPLFSQYILDGVQMDETPFSALYDCLDGNGTVDVPKGPFADVVDEYLDKKPVTFRYDPDKAPEYVEKILHTPRNRKLVNLNYPLSWTKNAINSLLLECIFRDGHFTLQDILLMARWDWNNAPAGNMAAFYDSTVAAGRYLFDLGVKLDRYFVESNSRECRFDLEVRSKMSSRRKCSGTMGTDARDWLIYIPFDNGRYCLGGSALDGIIGQGSAVEGDVQDPDYFIDCYEVVRELVEDGVICAGVPVGYGGLATAAEKFRGRKGFNMGIGGIMSAMTETDPIRILFAETPGVIIEIKDDDYDYLDAQLLLQEVAYYPIGHPDPGSHELSIIREDRDNVAGILNSLMGIS